MKRQRNTQQVKEQDKCPPNQTKEEEIGNLQNNKILDKEFCLLFCSPNNKIIDKEFEKMIVKMIQNIENKMESQINSLETRI